MEFVGPILASAVEFTSYYSQYKVRQPAILENSVSGSLCGASVFGYEGHIDDGFIFSSPRDVQFQLFSIHYNYHNHIGIHYFCVLLTLYLTCAIPSVLCLISSNHIDIC